MKIKKNLTFNILTIVFCALFLPLSAQTQLGTDIDGEAAGDESGRSVSLSSDGSRVAIGAPYNDGTGIDRGHVRIYEYSGSSWTQLGIDINGEADADLSGWSVSLSPDGSRVAIGAPYNNGTGTDAGYVRIYEYSGGSWTQFGSDIDGEAAGDESGRSVSLSSDGSRVAIGAYHNDGTGTGAGHVRIFGLTLSSINQIFSQYNIKIYPNPSDGLLHLRDIEADFIRIMDNNGRILFEKHEPLSEIDISNLPNGIYILEVIIDNITIHKKIIKN